MDTVSHDDDRAPQHVCAGSGCKNAATAELQLNTGVFACDACASMVADLLARIAKFKYPTPELALAALTNSDRLLSPHRLQRLEHMRTLIRWAADAAVILGDPAIKDEQFSPGYLDDIDTAWARMQGTKGIGMLAAMQITGYILAAAGAKDEAAVSEAFNWLSAAWPEYHAKMGFEMFKAAVVKSVKAPDWQAIANALESAGVGGRDGRNEKRRWNPETIRTEYARWSAKKPGIRLDNLLRRK